MTYDGMKYGGGWDMVNIEWTPIRIVPAINDPFRVFSVFVVVVLTVIIVINTD